MRLIVTLVPELGLIVRKEFNDLQKAIDFFLQGTRKVKRKKLWGVRIQLIYDDGSAWLMADCYQQPIKARGLDDLPKVNLLKLSKKKKTHRKQT